MPLTASAAVNRRILVVEEETAAALDLQMWLRRLGYDVPVIVNPGDAAIEQARELRPELVLMSLRFKGSLPGIKASLRMLREFRTPVIFVDRGQNAGGAETVGFALQPFHADHLHDAIQSALRHRPSETASRKNDRWFTEALSSVADGVIVVDQNREIAFMNTMAERLTGWRQEEALRRPLASVYILSALAPSGGSEILDVPLPGQEKTGREALLTSRNGTWLPIEENSAPILDEAGEAAGMVVVFRDITHRKRVEDLHRANEEQLRVLADSMSQLAWMAEPDGDIFWYNQRWYDYTGTSAQMMKESGWWPLHNPQTIKEVQSKWSHSLRTGQPLDMEFPLRGANGTFRWFLTRVLPLKNERGEVVRWFGTNTDIHDAREARRQLQLANANLVQFAYSASHDLREPLRNVALYSELLSQRCSDILDPDAAEYLSFITASARRMGTLVGDLFTYAESCAPFGRPLQQVDAASVLDEVLEGLKVAIAATQATISLGPLPTFRTRLVHLRQLLHNLLENALKYKADSPPAIHISANAAGGEWIFCVKDNGIGIEPQYHEQVFGLFKRLHHTAQYEGNGLGLALCQNIVGSYGGRIWVESELGQGAAFYFALPRE